MLHARGGKNQKQDVERKYGSIVWCIKLVDFFILKKFLHKNNYFILRICSIRYTNSRAFMNRRGKPLKFLEEAT